MSQFDFDPDKIEETVGHGPTVVSYPHTRISNVLEAIVDAFGRFFSWSWIILLALVVANVFLRYFFDTTFVALEELQWHLYSIGFMIALSYAVVKDGHVRVDVLAEQLSARKRAWIEMLGMTLLLMPFCVLILIYAYPFVERSYLINEVSGAPGGLPMRWLIKSVILIGFVLLLMSAVARALRALSLLTGFPKAIPAGKRRR